MYKDFVDETAYVMFKNDFLSEEDIIEFCSIESLPLVSVYSEDTAYRIFTGALKVSILINNLINNKY